MGHYQERLLKQDLNIDTSGDNTVITVGSGEMPAGWDNPATCILIDHINLIATGSTTLQFKSGTSSESGHAVYGGVYTLAAGQGMVLENAMQNPDDGVMRLGPNKSFVINLGSSVQVSGFIRYRLKNSN